MLRCGRSRRPSWTTTSSWRSDRHGNARGSSREERACRHQRRLQGEVRLPRPRGRLRLQSPEGPFAGGRRIDLRVQGRAAVDARLPPEGARPLLLPPDPDLGRQPRPDRLRRHPLLRPRLRKEQPRLERGAGGHQEHLRPARHPRGRAQIPLRGRRPVRVGGRLPPGQREARGTGRDLHRHGHGAARARGHRARVLGDRDPPQRQQTGGAQLRGLVGRLLRLRAGRGQGRDAAAGLLPDQHREHGPVRADADHRRGGLRRPLHRGLHGTGLLDRLAALRGGRDRLQAELPGPLHDGPELVPERLQPRHQARRRPGEGDDGVGRLQPRLEADDEVPVDLPARPGSPRRDPLDRLRRRRASTRTPAARSSTVRRAPRPRSSPSRSPRTAVAAPTAACSRSPTARRNRARRSSATRCCSTRTRARTPTRRSGSARTTPTSATRPRSRRSATSRSSTCRATGSTRRRPRR